MRFYERRGLLRPTSRSSGNYRFYGRAAAERRTFIGAAQPAGFELPQIDPRLGGRQNELRPRESAGFVATMSWGRYGAAPK
jgi:DNA-binding transcriptional MerR regulator